MSSDEHDEFPRTDPAPTMVGGEPPAETPGAVIAPPAAPPAFDSPDSSEEPEPESAQELEAESTEEPEAESTEEPEAESEQEPESTREPAEPSSQTDAGPETGEASSESEPADDPFAAWPQAETAAVIEDIPADPDSVEHVAGRDRRPRRLHRARGHSERPSPLCRDRRRTLQRWDHEPDARLRDRHARTRGRRR